MKNVYRVTVDVAGGSTPRVQLVVAPSMADVLSVYENPRSVELLGAAQVVKGDA